MNDDDVGNDDNIEAGSSNLIKQKVSIAAHKQHMPHYNFGFNLLVARFHPIKQIQIANIKYILKEYSKVCGI